MLFINQSCLKPFGGNSDSGNPLFLIDKGLNLCKLPENFNHNSLFHFKFLKNLVNLLFHSNDWRSSGRSTVEILL